MKLKFTNNIRNRISKMIPNAICILIIIIFGYISFVSILQTSVINPDKYVNENILYKYDNILLNFNILLNLTLICLFFSSYLNLRKKINFSKKIKIKYMYLAMFIYVVIVGFMWVYCVQSVPSADSRNVFQTASLAAVNDYSPFYNGTEFYNHAFYNNISYFNYYPFQLGFVFVCELILRLFNTSNPIIIQYINVLCVAFSYICIAKITGIIFKRKDSEYIAILLLMLCLQPILFTTFVYGNLIGMCFALLASVFLIKYFKSNKYYFLLLCCITLTIATLAKYNNMIYLIAFSIMLLCHFIKEKKWQSLAFVFILCISTIGSKQLIITSYESRANVKLNDGISQIMYLNMGLSESYMAPGWFNGSTIIIFQENDLNVQKANVQTKEELKMKISKFVNDPKYMFSFFNKKIISQWNETSYESIWVSKVKEHKEPINHVVSSVYDGKLHKILNEYFNQYMQILFICFTLGTCIILSKNDARIENTLLLLVLLGAFGYHLLFEGKSQYILTYIILMIPFASYAIDYLLNNLHKKC